MGNKYTKSQENSEEWNGLLAPLDAVSGTYNVLLTYVINHLILPSQVQEIAQSIKKYDRHSEFCASGSRAEGLCLPDAYSVDVTGYGLVDQSDSDILWIDDNHCVFLSLEDAIKNGGNLYLESSETYPGFTCVRIIKPEYINEKLRVKRTENGQVVWYMSPGKFMRGMRNLMQIPSISTGPACSFEAKGSVRMGMEKVLEKSGYPFESPADIVRATKLSKWPYFMERWKNRQKLSLPSTLKALISEGRGCLLVNAAHRHSKDPEIEFRISCSVPELFVAQQLNDIQRQVYMAFKYLVKEATTGQKGIMTYHLKTTMFWTIEEFPAPLWNADNLAQCLFLLLDKFIQFLASGYLPNYFIPESNLLSHLSRDHIRTALLSILKLREDPLDNLMQYQRRKRLAGNCLQWNHSLHDILNPYIKPVTELLDGYKSSPMSSIMLFVQIYQKCETDIYCCRLAEMKSCDTLTIANVLLTISPLDIERNLICGNWYSIWAQSCRKALQACDTNSQRLEIAYKCYMMTCDETGLFQNQAYSDPRLLVLEAWLHKILAENVKENRKADKCWDASAVLFTKLVSYLEIK